VLSVSNILASGAFADSVSPWLRNSFARAMRRSWSAWMMSVEESSASIL
jgi:hypothetical protein